MGVWIEAAIWDRARREVEDGAVSPTKPRAQPLPSAPILDAGAVASLLHTYVGLAASAKVPADKGVVKEYAALLRDLMRRMREGARGFTVEVASGPAG